MQVEAYRERMTPFITSIDQIKDCKDRWVSNLYIVFEERKMMYINGRVAEEDL